MIVYENECVGCPPELGCLGKSCSNRNVPHFYCDCCDDEDELFYFEGKQLCINCIKDRLEEVTG